MTEPPTAPHRQTAEDGSRFYPFTNPTTGTVENYWSVTTALSAKAKEGLKWWAAGLSSDRAMANLPKLVASQRVEACGRTNNRKDSPNGERCDTCPDCMARWLKFFHIGESNRRKHEGSAVHDALESWIKHQVIPTPGELARGNPLYLEEHPGIAEALPPYLASMERWIREYAIEPSDFRASEMTIFNDVYKYGGTLDFLLMLTARNVKSAKLLARITGRTDHRPALVVGDAKSREGEGKQFYDEHALQLAPYHRATWCMPSKVDRLLKPMPTTAGAVIIQIRPDGYTFEPVRVEDAEFEAFLAALKLFRWTVEHGSAAIAVKTFPVPDGYGWPPKPTTYARATTPDGKPCACPACDDPSSSACMFAPAAREPGVHVRKVDAAGVSQLPPPAKRATPRKRAAKKAAAAPAPAHTGVEAQVAPTVTVSDPRGSMRMAGATLQSITDTGGKSKGNTLRDEDIPF